jgi:hypothetical protein
MHDVDFYLNELKSSDEIVRNKAVIAVCQELIVQGCKSGAKSAKIAEEIKLIYQSVGPDARCVALDILGRSMPEEEFHELVRGELGYAYLQFRMSHSYLFKILSQINGIDFENSLMLGDYFDFNKQMNVAFKLLKDSDSDALN